MDTFHKFLIYLSLLLAVISIIFHIKNYFFLKALYCDLATGFHAERQFTFPILREIGNPDKPVFDINGNEVVNPVIGNGFAMCR